MQFKRGCENGVQLFTLKGDCGVKGSVPIAKERGECTWYSRKISSLPLSLRELQRVAPVWKGERKTPATNKKLFVDWRPIVAQRYFLNQGAWFESRISDFNPHFHINLSPGHSGSWKTFKGYRHRWPFQFQRRTGQMSPVYDSEPGTTWFNNWVPAEPPCHILENLFIVAVIISQAPWFWKGLQGSHWSSARNMFLGKNVHFFLANRVTVWSRLITEIMFPCQEKAVEYTLEDDYYLSIQTRAIKKTKRGRLSHVKRKLTTGILRQ